MIKYECDMCHKIFDGEYVDEYNIPRLIDLNYFRLKLAPHSTHLCIDCAKKIADMMGVVVDK